jgi:hypothetical protein
LVDPNGLEPGDGCTAQHPCQEYPLDWATNGVHPEQAIIQESVTVNIADQSLLETTTSILGTDIEMRPTQAAAPRENDSLYFDEFAQEMGKWEPALRQSVEVMWAIGNVEIGGFTTLGGGGVATLGLESGQEAGSASVNFFRLSSGAHFSVATEANGAVLETEQVITNSQSMSTTIRIAEQSQRALSRVDIALPNGQAAMARQLSLIGSEGGTYNAATNSCLTHCMDILRAGGLNVPNTTRGAIKFLQSVK